MTAAVPSTRIARKPRSLRLTRWNASIRAGVVEITEARSTAVYSLCEVESGYAERAFRLAKVAETTDGPLSIESPYFVALERQGHSCECMGHLAHGHKTPCRHVAAVLKLIEEGLI